MVSHEIIDYHDDKPKRKLLTFDEKVVRKGNCGAIHKKRTNGTGDIGIETCYCGDPTCKNCFPHRTNSAKDEFSWINAHNYIIKIISSVETDTKDHIQKAYELNQKTKENILLRNPGLSFGTALSSKHVVCILPKSSDVLQNAIQISFEDFINEYVDWTHIIDGSESHEYLVMNHQKRLLSHKLNRKQPVKMCACVIDANDNAPKKFDDPDNKYPAHISCPTPKKQKLKPDYHALHMKSNYENDEEAKKMLKSGTAKKSKFVDVREAKYAIIDEDTEHEPVMMSFNDLLLFRIDGLHVDQWELYLGKFESRRTQNYLKYIANTDVNFKWLKTLLDSGTKLV